MRLQLPTPLDRGLVIRDQLSVISENQLYEHRVVQRRRKRQQEVSEEFLIRSLHRTQHWRACGAYRSWGRTICRTDHAGNRWAGS
jgi:hypothetical protein